MKKLDLCLIQRTIRSVGAGPTLGASLACLAYHALLRNRLPDLPSQQIALFGVAVAMLLQRIGTGLGPTLCFYGKAAQLRLQVRLRWLSQRDALVMMRKLQADYFVGSRIMTR